MDKALPPREFHAGDQVIYRVTKQTAHPARRARWVRPSAHGELYTYAVDKQWLVSDVRGDGRLVVSTRRGKQHLISPDDPALRHASLWERFTLRGRFPRPSGDAPPLPKTHAPKRTH